MHFAWHHRHKNSVEDRLHQRGAEEMFAPLAGELHAEGLFQGLADGGQGGEVHGFDARALASRA